MSTSKTPEKPKLTEAQLGEFAEALKDTINAEQEYDAQATRFMNEAMEGFKMPTLVESSVKLIKEQNPFKRIELAGRTCYKSEDAITPESAKKFTASMMKNNHTAMIEHAAVVAILDCDDGFDEELKGYIHFVSAKPLNMQGSYLNVTVEPDIPRIMVSGNIRAILQRHIIHPLYRALVAKYPEFAYPDDTKPEDIMYDHVTATLVDIRKIKDLTRDEFMNHFYLTAKMITDRGVTHEIVRHRPFSFAQESTRYCNYSKEKFGGECTFCKPSTYEDWTQDQQDVFCSYLATVNNVYNYLTTSENPLAAQQARAVLPNCLKAEIVVTGPAYEWNHFFNLRSKGTTGKPHPDMKAIADETLKITNKYIKKLNFINDLTF